MSNAKPLFSIIIPTYNRREKLKKAIESVLKQTHKDFELIIVDDGSKDNTGELVKSFIDERIVYKYQDNSGLPSVARNTGITIARGEWTCFLDSDDFWTDNKLAVVASEINKKPDVQVFSHNEYLIGKNNEEKGILRHWGDFGDNPRHYMLTKANFLSPSAIVIKTNLLQDLKGFDVSAEFYSVEDYELWIRLASVAKFGYIDEILGYYLVDGEGISSNLIKHFNCLKNVFLKYTQTLPNPDLQNQSWGYFYSGMARSYQLGGLFKEAKEASLNGMKYKNYRLKSFIIYSLSTLGLKK